MKRTLVLTIVLLILISLAGCASNTDQQVQEDEADLIQTEQQQALPPESEIKSIESVVTEVVSPDVCPYHGENCPYGGECVNKEYTEGAHCQNCHRCNSK